MRWALSHATNRSEVVRIAYEGVTVPSRTNFPEYGGLAATYIDALEEAGLTQSPVADVAAAQAIIESKGYALNNAGIYEKDGAELGIDIQTHEGFIEKRRIAENLVEQWRQAGIAATQTNVAGGTWNDNRSLGNFEASGDWHSCGSINEPWASMDRDNVNWFAPIGEPAPRRQQPRALEWREGRDLQRHRRPDRQHATGRPGHSAALHGGHGHLVRGTADTAHHAGDQADPLQPDLLDRLAYGGEQLLPRADLVAQYGEDHPEPEESGLTPDGFYS